MIQPKILKNNLKTVVYPLRSTEAITIMILIGVGSRDENQSLRGISHFLEHMFFKGGQKYKTAQDVALAIDSVGGDFNAFTGKEYTGYYVKTAKENVDVAFSVLSDMMMNARFDQFEIEKERGVILEEFNLYQDTPMYQIGWDFEHLLFGDQPLGWDQIGTKDNIRRFNQEDFINYKNDFYTEDNTTIVIAGNIDEDEGYRKIGEYFDFKNSVKTKGRVPYVKMPQGDKISITEKNTEQGHMVMGYLGVPFGDEREAASKLLSVVLGGNMSSRMFTEIREKRGLCYSVSTSGDYFSDTGSISTHAGVDLLRIEEAAQAIRDEYENMAQNGITENELERAKSFLKGKITLRMEDSEELASMIASQITHLGYAKRIKSLFHKIEKVSKKEVEDLARELFVPANLHMSLIGPFGEKRDALLKIIQ